MTAERCPEVDAGAPASSAEGQFGSTNLATRLFRILETENAKAKAWSQPRRKI
jgi:hypothetical protein